MSGSKWRFWQRHPMAAGSVAGLALLALVNYAVGRWAEHKNQPRGLFMRVDGLWLHYRDIGHGTPVVLIHGNAVDGEDWDRSGLADSLAQNHRVIMIDRPGCGYSERPHGTAWTAQRQADLLQRALLQLDVEQPIIVGHSFGAIVALALVTRNPGYAACLVVLSGYYFWTVRPDILMAAIGAMPVIGDIVRYTIAPLLNRLQLPLIKWAMFSPAPVPARFKEHYSGAMALRPSQLRATALDGTLMIPAVVELEPLYHKLDLPVTIVAGAGDRIVFKRNAEQLKAAVPHSELYVFEGAGHMVHYFAPEQIGQWIDRMAKSETAQVS